MTVAALRARAVGMLERAYSVLTIKAAEEGDDARIVRGIATTPEPDRYGDIVEPLGVTFENPLPLLHQHDTKRPVGTVTLHKPTKDGITFEARLAKITEPGPLKDRVDTAWGELKAGLVRAVSIGFRPLERAFLDKGGVHFIKSEVLELSLVTVPANAGATILELKSIDRALRAALGQERGTVVRLNPSGASGKRLTAKEAIPVKKSIAETIKSFEDTRVQKTARMDTIIDESSDKGETLDAQQKEEYDTLERELKEINEHLGRLRIRERSALQTAVPAKGDSEDEGTGSRGRPNGTIQVRSTKLPPGVGFVRMLTARYAAMKDNCSPADIAIARGWGEDMVALLRVPKSVIQRAAVAPGTTTDVTWAAPLVLAQNLTGEFIEIVRQAEILSRIPGLRRMPFNVKVPRQTGVTTAYWVAEGAPKPVSKAAFDTVSLGFNKCAGITIITDELARFSVPAAESLLVRDLTAAIVKLVDHDFIDPAKAAVAGTSPASITNGVSAIPATGTTGDAFRTDMNTALATFTAAGLGVRDLAIVMQETQAMSLGLIRNSLTGNNDFPAMGATGGNINGIPVVASQNVPSGVIAFISTPNILLADEGGVEVDISTEATLQASDAPDNPVLATTIAISLWQNNLVGIRCERYVTWAKAMTGAVTYISGANYH